jgi:hypothetical protein
MGLARTLWKDHDRRERLFALAQSRSETDFCGSDRVIAAFACAMEKEHGRVIIGGNVEPKAVRDSVDFHPSELELDFHRVAAGS